jgi:hypothetical protein
MQKFTTIEEFNTAAPNTSIPAAYVHGLINLTRRPVEVSDNAVRGWFTTQRYLELGEVAGIVSAVAVAKIAVAGRLVEIALYVGDVHTVMDVGRLVRRAAAAVSEVVQSGSHARGVTVLGEGVRSDGTRLFAYGGAGINPAQAANRFASFAERNGIELAGAVEEKPAKKTSKSKAAAA